MRCTLCVGLLLALVSSSASAAELHLSKGPGPLEITLDWTGGVPAFEVYRSTSPQLLTAPLNQVGGTAGSTWIEPTPIDPIVFYRVIGADNYPFFSEYVEGSASNKALEIAITASPADNVLFDLGTCSIRTYLNGSITPSVLALPVHALLPNEAYVVCNSGAGVTLAPHCALLAASTALGFNGDDAVELLCNGRTCDVIGQIGFDPGAEWGTGNASTADNTIRRLCSVLAGDANGVDAFDPATGWAGFATDTFDGLGDRACAP